MFIKRLINALLACVFAAGLLSSCSTDNDTSPRPPVTPAPSPPTASPTALLTSDIAEALKGLWGKIDGSTATIPLTEALHRQLGGGETPPVHQTTPIAYERLIAKTSDLIFVTHPSEDEMESARRSGVTLEIIPVVKDALVFLINTENPVDGATMDDIRDIYTGRITNWGALGGYDRSIIPYQRTPNSGSQTLFLKLVMDGRTPMTAPAEWIAAEMGWLVEVVSSYDNARDAIGYSMFYYVNNMYGNSQFKLLAVDGVKPSRETIAGGEYPLEDCYYAVIRKDTPADDPARLLIDWVLTDEGQALAVRAGYIPIRPMASSELDADIDPVYLGDVDNSAGTGGTVYKGWDSFGEMVSHGVRKPLSDAFYDGFNYIRYINSEIAKEISTARVSEYDSSNVKPPLGEELAIRPFFGFPNDYPNYEMLGNGLIRFHLPDDNPFFLSALSFDVRLTEEISPYGEGLGGFSEVYHRVGRLMPNIDLFSLSVGIPDAPDITERINAQIDTWVDGFPGDKGDLLGAFVSWYGSNQEYPYRFQPLSGRWKDYLCVTYTLQTYDGPIIASLPVMFTVCFDLRTGDTVNLADALPGDLPFQEANVIEPISEFRGEYYDGEMIWPESIENYRMPEGTVIDEAWLLGDYLLGLRITEPNGRKLQVSFWQGWQEG